MKTPTPHELGNFISSPAPQQNRIRDFFVPANSPRCNIPTSNCFAALFATSEVSQSNTLLVDQSKDPLREDRENAGLGGHIQSQFSFLTAKAVRRNFLQLQLVLSDPDSLILMMMAKTNNSRPLKFKNNERTTTAQTLQGKY